MILPVTRSLIPFMVAAVAAHTVRMKDDIKDDIEMGEPCPIDIVAPV